MNKIINKVDNSKHIVVVADASVDSISSASAFYTYLLTLHKKVSFFCISSEIDNRLSFIPWFEKIRYTFASSSDLVIGFGSLKKEEIGVECDYINIDIANKNFISLAESIYNLFKNNGIKMNKKIATSLYAGILDCSKGFLDDRVDGTFFAVVQELIDLGADTKVCNRYIMNHMSLAAFRLKAKMQIDMKLELDAKVALFVVSDNDLLSSGATENDCEKVILESLFLPTVNIALLLREHNDLSVSVLLKSDGELDVLKIASLFNGVGNSKIARFDFINKNHLKEEKIKLIYKEIEFESKK
ncbi:MAG: phosphoesterase [Campylobacterota bacterium]|nr:phosphoesterase [Campylobacterota bacterium]